MKCAEEYMRLYAVTDRAWLGNQTLAQQVEQAILGGVTCVQLREKACSDAVFLQQALAVQAVCKHYGVPLFINDNVSVAMACGADGVHVGQCDMQAAQAREQIGADKLLGVSVQTVQQAIQAEQNGADCLGVGAVFQTDTKRDADSVPLETLQAICRAVSIPVVAIGGITKDNMLQLRGSGVAGVAVVSAIFASADIRQACVQLRKLAEQVAQDKEEM